MNKIEYKPGMTAAQVKAAIEAQGYKPYRPPAINTSIGGSRQSPEEDIAYYEALCGFQPLPDDQPITCQIVPVYHLETLFDYRDDADDNEITQYDKIYDELDSGGAYYWTGPAMPQGPDDRLLVVPDPAPVPKPQPDRIPTPVCPHCALPTPAITTALTCPHCGVNLVQMKAGDHTFWTYGGGWPSLVRIWADGIIETSYRADIGWAGDGHRLYRLTGEMPGIDPRPEILKALGYEEVPKTAGKIWKLK